MGEKISNEFSYSKIQCPYCKTYHDSNTSKTNCCNCGAPLKFEKVKNMKQEVIEDIEIWHKETLDVVNGRILLTYTPIGEVSIYKYDFRTGMVKDLINDFSIIMEHQSLDAIAINDSNVECVVVFYKTITSSK